jgi:hypothetical protein
MRNSMMSRVSMLLVAGSFSIGNGFANDSLPLDWSGRIVNHSEAEEGEFLHLRFKSKDPVSGVCPLIVQRFEYVPALSALQVEVRKDTPCMTDDIGIVSGSFVWKMPRTFAKGKQSFHIVLNGKATSVRRSSSTSEVSQAVE